MESGQSNHHHVRPSAQPVAIIGMSCIFPGAPSLKEFWHNIVHGVDSIREAGSLEWEAERYKESRPHFGQIYCTRGGFISEYARFDPLEFGIMPASVNGSDPDQLLALKVAAEALRDAGYHHKSFKADRAEIVVGRTSAPGIGSLNLVQHGQTIDQVIGVITSLFPSMTPDELALIETRLRTSLRPCNSDTIPAVMPNVLAGRIAAKLGFRGRNLILDAACASSLIAVETAVQGLQSGQSDLAIAGGIHVNSSPCFYQMFSELKALSASGVIRPFDDAADGTILGEGVGMVVMKRLDDAISDGNRIYAVLRGVGSSSDGRTGGLLAPNTDGEALAMMRAYEASGVSPSTVGLLEAHGTGTKLGDLTEIRAVEQVFLQDKPSGTEHRPWCALGSVKSMIGHTQAASGIAGLIKVSLALYHKVLPGTLNIEKPNSQVDWDNSACYLNTVTRVWDQELRDGTNEHPRRAAVSAFGFGGVNSHAVLEEFIPDPQRLGHLSPSAEPIEVLQSHPISAAASARIEPLEDRSILLDLTYPVLDPRVLSAVRLGKGIAQSQEPTRLPPAAPADLPKAVPDRPPQKSAGKGELAGVSATETVLPRALVREISLTTGETAGASTGHQSHSDAAPLPGPPFPAERSGEEPWSEGLVVREFLSTTRRFHRDLLAVEGTIMASYLSDSNPAGGWEPHE